MKCQRGLHVAGQLGGLGRPAPGRSSRRRRRGRRRPRPPTRLGPEALGDRDDADVARGRRRRRRCGRAPARPARRRLDRDRRGRARIAHGGSQATTAWRPGRLRARYDQCAGLHAVQAPASSTSATPRAAQRGGDAGGHVERRRAPGRGGPDVVAAAASGDPVEVVGAELVAAGPDARAEAGGDRPVAPASRSAATAASITPSARPRQPAWTTPTRARRRRAATRRAVGGLHRERPRRGTAVTAASASAPACSPGAVDRRPRRRRAPGAARSTGRSTIARRRSSRPGSPARTARSPSAAVGEPDARHRTARTATSGTTGRRSRRRRRRRPRRTRSALRSRRPSSSPGAPDAALRRCGSRPLPSSHRSKPAAMTVTRTSSPISSSMTAPKMMLASGWATPWMTSAASLTSNRPRSLPPEMLSRMPRAPSMEASSSGLEMAARAASSARPSPAAVADAHEGGAGVAS